MEVLLLILVLELCAIGLSTAARVVHVLRAR